ncbi:nucleolin [Calliphora vicina]|uniref:nucleolin n=1 Tax=Calliphora vicina TaxID=7373 RepID=UPI00325B1AA7
MKRKNVNVVPTNVSEEESSDDEQQITDDDLEMDGDEEESVIDNDEEAEDSDNEALDASATDSDEDGSDVESDTNEDQEEVVPQKSKSEKVKEEILQRYEQRHGKQLYIRFPHKVPETQEALDEKVKELTPLVVKVHKPRQRHVRFCLVDFATNEDRDAALNDLNKSIKEGTLEKYVVKIPRTESSDFVSELAERKIKSIENKKAKLRLKKASKKSLKENNFTSTVIVLNLPKTASLLQVRELFKNAVDINIKPGKGKINKDKCIAAITLPTTMDARNTIKKKLSLEGNQLIIRFDNQKSKKKRKSDKTKNIGNKKDEQIKEESERKLETSSNTTKDESVTENETVKKINTNKGKKGKKNTVENKQTKEESEPKQKKPKLETPSNATKDEIVTKNEAVKKINNNKSKKGKKNTVQNKLKVATK